MSLIVQDFKKGLVLLLKKKADDHSAKIGKGMALNDDPLKTAQSYAQAVGRYKGLEEAILLVDEYFKTFNKNEEQ